MEKWKDCVLLDGSKEYIRELKDYDLNSLLRAANFLDILPLYEECVKEVARRLSRMNAVGSGTKDRTTIEALGIVNARDNFFL